MWQLDSIEVGRSIGALHYERWDIVLAGFFPLDIFVLARYCTNGVDFLGVRRDFILELNWDGDEWKTVRINVEVATS